MSRFLSVVSIGNNNNFLELDEIFKKKFVVKEEHFKGNSVVGGTAGG